MQEAEVGALLRDTMLVVLKLGGPPLLAGLAIGLVISLVQAVTQIHEQTLAFVPKLFVVGVVLLLLGSFAAASLDDFARLIFARVVMAGGA